MTIKSSLSGYNNEKRTDRGKDRKVAILNHDSKENVLKVVFCYAEYKIEGEFFVCQM